MPPPVFHDANFSKDPKARKMSKKILQGLKEVDFRHIGSVFHPPATKPFKKLAIWPMRLRGLPKS
jgi:hypothetical protein